jgi:phage terminase small subunit
MRNALSTSEAHPLHSLDPRERQFAMFIVEGKSVRTSATLAGYSHEGTNGTARKRLSEDPRIVRAVNFLRKKNEQSILTSRKKVLEGFLEAIEQAKLMSEPMVQIAGWREIGKMCGYYAPEVKEININVGAKRVIGQLEVLSDKELLLLSEKDREAIESTAVEILSFEAPEASEASEP